MAWRRPLFSPYHSQLVITHPTKTSVVNQTGPETPSDARCLSCRRCNIVIAKTVLNVARPAESGGPPTPSDRLPNCLSLIRFVDDGHELHYLA
jgi:hypothetical protein